MKHIYQKGLSLIELMIALLLGSILTLGLVQLFSSSSDTFRLAEATARIQESGRLAHEILGRAIRNADYWGCVRHAGVVNQLDDGDDDYDPEFHEFDPGDTSSVDVVVATAANTAKENSHVIRLKGANNQGVVLDGPMNNASANLDVTTTGNLAAGDILVLSDCSDGVVFQATQVQSNSNKVQRNTGNNAPGNLKGNCPPGQGPNSANCFPKAFTTGEIYKAYTHHYEVREDNNGRSALFRVGENETVELIDGVEDMQVQVGTGPDDVVTTWTDVDDGGFNANNIKALRVSLLVRSARDNIASSPQSVCFPAWVDCTLGDNWTAAAGDRHFYRVYTSTYSVRNRLLEAL